ncbi:MAG: hypothetical protein ACRCSO_09505 [Sphingomonas sp.]
MRNRRIALLLVALALVASAFRHPSATITVATQDVGDPAPHRFQAAVDVGLMAVSVIITWTSKHLSDAR